MNKRTADAEPPKKAARVAARQWTKLTESDASSSFQALVDEKQAAISPEILAGLLRCGFKAPTPLQSAAIPLALSGLDCIINSATGTGKTLAYSVPILSLVCSNKVPPSPTGRKTIKFPWRCSVQAIILVPSRELVLQVSDVLSRISFHCGDFVRIWTLPTAPTSNLRDLKFETAMPSLMITHPGALYKVCRLLLGSLATESRNQPLVFFPNLRSLVIDEADLILHTFGFHRETSELFRPDPTNWDGRNVVIIPMASSVSRRAQVILSSATLNDELAELRRMALYKPAIVCLSAEEESPENNELWTEEETSSLTHVVVKADAPNSRAAIKHFIQVVNRKRKQDYLYLFALLRFGWCSPKSIVFTSTVDQAYKCFLFLQHFGFSVGVVTPVQPLSLRLETIAKFNQSVFEILVGCDSAFDSQTLLDEPYEKPKRHVPITHRRSKKKAAAADLAASVSRGLDFKGVCSIVCFNPSENLQDYVHRTGRAARGFHRAGVVGRAVCIVDAKEAQSEGFQLISKEYELAPISDFDHAAATAFNYRVEDIARGLTSTAVSTAQVNELSQSLLKSNIKTLSEADVTVLKLVTKKRKSGVKPMLKALPNYLTAPTKTAA